MSSPTLRSVRRPLLTVAVLAILSLIAPLGAHAGAQGAAANQIDDDAPGLAPAIAAWAGSPRGHFTDIEPGVDSLTLSAIMADPDSAQGVSYEVLVDGAVVADGTSPGATAAGRTTRVTETISVAAGVHQVCLRLADRSNPGRTVHCRQATTIPPTRAASSLAATANGVVVSPSGVVVPVVSGSTNNWRVTTPCGNIAALQSGTFIDRARIVIDPGHGGSETGAVSGSLQEKDLNLVVSELVIERFERLGISAQITRTGDYRLPIQTRADIASALAPDVFLSIHHNGGAVRRSSVPGTEVFYSVARPESQRLAAILYEELFEAASQFDANWVSTVNQGASVRLNERGTDLYGIHRFSPDIDSAITEFMYLSNPSEAALLARRDVLDAQADAIVDGVLRWWFTSDAGTSLGRSFTDPTSSGTGGFDACVDPSLTSGTVGSFGLGNLPGATDSSAEVSSLPTTASSTESPLLVPQLSLGSDPAIAVPDTAAE